MKSTSGKYYPALDHARALAAYCVFVWHFTHGEAGIPVPFNSAPAMAILDEGHIGVAIFMTLSGYLFAKLLDGKDILYRSFLWNRLVRLAPLLIIVAVIAGVIQYESNGDMRAWFRTLLTGFIKPRWPNGAWSITVELHFYLMLPLLLALTRRWRMAPLLLVAVFIAVRAVIYLYRGEVQDAAYWTIIGRADDFLFGVAAFQFRSIFTKQHALAAAILIAISSVYGVFDLMGGWYGTHSSPIWIILPTLEASACASMIAYYDTTWNPSGAFSRGLSNIGNYSYSIYLIHPFFVFWLGGLATRDMPHASNFYVSVALATLCFVAIMAPVGWLSFHLVERPFLRLRRTYIKSVVDLHQPVERLVERRVNIA